MQLSQLFNFLFRDLLNREIMHLISHEHTIRCCRCRWCECMNDLPMCSHIIIAYLLDIMIDHYFIMLEKIGEEKHLVEDAKTEDEHQSNRRTEFKVIKINKK